MILPSLILLVVFLLFPVLTGFAMAFQRTSLSGVTRFAGFDNYIQLFREGSRFFTNLRVSLTYVICNILLVIPMSYGTALLITRKSRMARFFRSIYLLPWIIAPVVSTMMVRTMLNGDVGLIQFIIRAITHRENLLLTRANTALMVMIFHSFWRSFPIALIAAFSLARFSFKGREPMAMSLLILPMLPATAVLVPLVSYFNRMYLYNTMTSVVIVNVVFNIPLSTWMLRNFIVNIPRAIEEAACLDGLGYIRTLFRITLPSIRPGLAAVMIYIFIGCWNGYTFSYALTTSPNKRVLAQGILAFLGSWGNDWGGLNAAGLLMVFPPVLVFLVFQRSFVAGMFGQSLK